MSDDGFVILTNREEVAGEGVDPAAPDDRCPACHGKKSSQAKTCRRCMPKRKGKRGPRKEREPYRYEDPEAHLGPLLVREGRGWKFLRDVRGFAFLNGIKAGHMLYPEPWKSCYQLNHQTGEVPTEEWSIGSERMRWGIPEDWGRLLLDSAGLSPFTGTN